MPGDTVWRKCKTRRLSVLNDAAAYFAALREALLLATHQVYVIGWDIHSQTRFVGPSGDADDGFPEQLGTTGNSRSVGLQQRNERVRT